MKIFDAKSFHRYTLCFFALNSPHVIKLLDPNLGEQHIPVEFIILQHEVITPSNLIHIGQIYHTSARSYYFEHPDTSLSRQRKTNSLAID